MSPSTYSFDKKANDGKMLWTPAMHNEFLDALETLGEANAVPTIILEHLGWKNVSRQQIGSHLQKHRARLRSGREIRYRHHEDEMLKSFETPVSSPAPAPATPARRQKRRIGIESSETIIDESQNLPKKRRAASRAAKMLTRAKMRRSVESAQPASKTKKKKKKKVATPLVEEDDIQQQHFGSLLDLAKGRVCQHGEDGDGATKSTSRKAKRPTVPEPLPSGSGLLLPPQQLPQLPTSAHEDVNRSPRTELAPDRLATKTQDHRTMLLAMQSLHNEEGRNEHASGSKEQQPAVLPTSAVDPAAQLQYAVDDIVRENDRLRMQNQRLEAKMKRLEHAWKSIEGTISQYLQNEGPR